ncbi:transposase [Rhodococcus sp. ACPA4]|uniref:transposase n=1 Tax=Rhodococcus sp. ACPA4 TaxID=2028571 RepID=UPI0015C6AB6E
MRQPESRYRRSGGSPPGCYDTEDNLTDDEQIGLKQILASCPHLEATAGHVASFAEMLAGRLGAQLNSWMSAVSADDLPQLHRFVRGLETDHAAVLNGLTLPYSSGTVERHVNRIKMLKRQMLRVSGFRLASQTNTSQRLTLSKSITESGPEPKSGCR